jgi:hypothetical protein
MPLTTSLQHEEVEVAYSDDHDSLSQSHVPAPPLVPLLDIEAALEIPKDVADGYLILLSGGNISAKTIKEKRQKDLKRSKSSPNDGGNTFHEKNQDTVSFVPDMNFAFATLSDGNVIDAAFGVESNGGLKRSKTTSEIAFNAAKAAKQAIADASVSSEHIKKLAVETYIRLFEIIIQLHLDLENIGFITWCVKHQKIQERAIQEIKHVFGPLNEAIASSI